MRVISILKSEIRIILSLLLILFLVGTTTAAVWYTNGSTTPAWINTSTDNVTTKYGSGTTILNTSIVGAFYDSFEENNLSIRWNVATSWVVSNAQAYTGTYSAYNGDSPANDRWITAKGLNITNIRLDAFFRTAVVSAIDIALGVRTTNSSAPTNYYEIDYCCGTPWEFGEVVNGGTWTSLGSNAGTAMTNNVWGKWTYIINGSNMKVLLNDVQVIPASGMISDTSLDNGTIGIHNWMTIVGSTWVDDVWVRNTTSLGVVAESGNRTLWVNAGSGYQVNSTVVYMKGNWSVGAGNNTTRIQDYSYTAPIVANNSVWNNQTLTYTIKHQNYFINITHIGTNTSTPELYGITTYSEPVGAIPPVPVISTVTTGTFWVNQSWTAGAGNITNSYNVSVNGAWNNTSSVPWRNTSVGAGNWSNLTVFAYNSSGTGSLSATALTNNTQAPLAIPPTPINLANTTGNFWINHTWQAGIGNVTDSFNISQNGTWTNGSYILFKNVTVAPHGWSNITIYAFNNSG